MGSKLEMKGSVDTEIGSAESYKLSGTVNWTFVQPLLLVRRILNLQSSFDVFHGSRNETDSRASHGTSNTMTDTRELGNHSVTRSDRLCTGC
jgi:hypothetical protein